MTTSNHDSEFPLRWDDRTWQVLPPIAYPDNSDPVEVAPLALQPLEIMGRYYLVFSLSLESHSPEHQQTVRTFIGIYYMVANNPKGPFSTPKVLLTDPVEHLYGCQLVQSADR